MWINAALVGTYPSAEVLLVYSTAPANWAISIFLSFFLSFVSFFPSFFLSLVLLCLFYHYEIIFLNSKNSLFLISSLWIWIWNIPLMWINAVLGGTYPSAEVLLVYSTAPANWAISIFLSFFFLSFFLSFLLSFSLSFFGFALLFYHYEIIFLNSKTLFSSSLLPECLSSHSQFIRFSKLYKNKTNKQTNKQTKKKRTKDKEKKKAFLNSVDFNWFRKLLIIVTE